MSENYDHKKIEAKWQKNWNDTGIHKVQNRVEGKENFFQLVEFSYPSGNLHVGHWYAFSVPDIMARYKRMNGYNVLFPMGFDSFGLPAENAAIKRGLDPKKWTYENMDYMQKQLRSMGTIFDWDRKIATSDPEYYKWTQWMFNQFYKNDLAYRDTTKVNWCPKDQTVLANEQVINGECDRCGSDVVQKDQDQWMFRISKYADRLIDDLETVDFSDSIKESQKAWIGRSEGAELSFKLSTSDEVKVFTTRPDTLFGATYVVLAPEHELVVKLQDKVSNWNEVQKYIDETNKKSDLDRQQLKEKTGVELKGVTAINPATKEEISVWVADYVLGGYGTGAVMAVPAHDERDFEFAKNFDLPIKTVVVPSIEDSKNPHVEGWEVKERQNVHAIVYDPKKDAYLTLDWHDYDWRTVVLGGIDEGEDIIECAKREVAEETGYVNIEFKKHLGSPVQTLYAAPHKGVNRLAWSTGIYFELIDDTQVEVSKDEHEKFDTAWMPAKDFIPENITNIELPFWQERIKGEEKVWSREGVLFDSGEFEGMTSNEAKEKITKHVGGEMKKTYRLRDWGVSRQRYWGCPIPIVYDPEGNAHAIPDEHLPWLLPEDVDHTPDGTAPLARSKELKERTEKIFGKGWAPEVETMDAFVDSSWYFYRYLDPKNTEEFCSKDKIKNWTPVTSYSGGAEHTTMHLLYSRFWNKVLFDLGFVEHSEPYMTRSNRALILGPDGNKMSKSKGNVIDPDEVVENVGADTVRMYLAFMGPYGVPTNYPWDPNGVVGIRRFIERVWNLQNKIVDATTEDLNALLHRTIKGVQEDVERQKYNTAISKMMIFVNMAEKTGGIDVYSYKTFLSLMAPFAPHATDEIWHNLGEVNSIHLSQWPKYDDSKIKDVVSKLVIQVNGKVRDTINIPTGLGEENVKELVFANEKIQLHIAGKEIVKFIFVPNKIANVVVK